MPAKPPSSKHRAAPARRATPPRAAAKRPAAPAPRADTEAAPVRRPFPRFTLERALVVVQAIGERNAGRPMDRMLLAGAVGRRPASADYRDLLSASRKYGLTEGTEKAADVSPTPLGLQIVQPQRAGEREEAIRRAALTPELFGRVLRHFDRGRLQSGDFFLNQLQRSFGVPAEYAEEVAAIIHANAEYAGLLHEISGVRYVRLAGAEAGPGAGAAAGSAPEPRADRDRGAAGEEDDETGEEDGAEQGAERAAALAGANRLGALLGAVDWGTCGLAGDGAGGAYGRGAAGTNGHRAQPDGHPNGSHGQVAGAASGAASRAPAAQKQIFLAHGKNREPLGQLKAVLDQFKIPSKVAVDEPHGGRPISQKVATLMNECSAAIFVFTKDEEFRLADGTSVWRPSENIVYELGAAAVLYGSKIIIFKEEGIRFASDFQDLGYITFAPGEIGSRALDLLKELIALEFIRVQPV